MSSLPSGTVTFLFTDIEGSTNLWQTYPQAMPAALALHHTLVRDAIELHNGRIFQIIGDAFCAAFAGAADALRAALAAQQALEAASWGEIGALRVRMGLHAGEAEIQDAEYLSGPALIRAQRCMTAGHGGQVLLTAAVQELARDDLPAGSRLIDLGAHRLKDLLRPEHIFQLEGPGLGSNFPPLRTLDSRPGNLPVQLTSFVGRERDLAEVRGLLETSHLLTLTGVGGTGKTRLALQVAAGVLDFYPGGVWLVELAPLADPALVPQVVASALGLREQPERPLMESLADMLRARRTLLLLDNCEHLIEACARLAETLLRACPRLTILATSREAIGISGEMAWYVPALSTPHPHQLSAESEALLSAVSHYEAVRLFVDRARAVQPGFTLNAQNAPAIVQICHQLDGIPLAIELATARLKALSLEQIAARLDDRFTLLTTGSRTALRRHQALRATIDWSYDLLPPAERDLFNRLSVFAGGWTLEAVEAIASAATVSSPQPASNVVDLLTRLVDKSLVVPDQTAGDQRYRMLETIRQYAREKLAAAQQSESLQMRHLNYFLRLARRAEPRLRSGEQVMWLDRLEAEHDNLRAALEWALKCGELEAGVQLAADLARFWYIRGYWSEGRDWLARMLAATSAFDPHDTELAEARADALNGAGWLADESGQDVALYDEALSLFRAQRDRWGAAFALRGLGATAANRGAYAEARKYLDESLVLFSAPPDPWGMALARFNRGWLASDQDEHEEAQAEWDDGLRLFEQTGDRWGIAVTKGALGYVYRIAGDYKRATALSKESLALFEEIGDKAGIATSLSRLAGVAYRRDDYKQATTLFEESIAVQRELGYERDTAVAYVSLALIACYQGDYARAEMLLQQSLAVWRELADNALGIARVNEAAALVAASGGDSERAEALWSDSLRVFRERSDRPGMVFALSGLARVALQHAETGRAAALVEESLACGRAAADRQLIAHSLFLSGRVGLALHDHPTASTRFKESLDLRREMGAKRGVADSLESLAFVALNAGQAARAARLCGAASGLRDAIGAPVEPVERPGYDDLLDATRALLGDTSFDSAWAAGRAQSLEHAIAEAMSE
jgi:predicted ATPase/class 3 adenylate cyclase